MAGDPEVVEKLKKGHKAIGRTYKMHIDGYNLVPYLTGKETKSPRKLLRLLQRRWRRRRPPLRQLEGRVHGAALPGHDADLGRAVHQAAASEGLQLTRPIPTSAPTSPPTGTTSGSCTTPTSSTARLRSAISGSRRSRSSRRGRSPDTFTHRRCAAHDAGVGRRRRPLRDEACHGTAGLGPGPVALDVTTASSSGSRRSGTRWC